MEKANTIIISNSIFDGLSNECFKGYIAIKDLKILDIGKGDYNKYIDNETKILDFKDKFVMPGIHDSHLHMFMSGLYNDPKVKVSMFDKSEDQCARSLKDIEDLVNKDEWLIGAGFYHTLWDEVKLPTKYSLDKYYKDRPVCMVSYDLHTLWLNSFGLKKLGIDANFKDIEGGLIDRDENGNPLGTFHEAASCYCLQRIYNFDEEYIINFYKNFINLLSSYGITTVSDMSMMAIPGMDFIRDDILRSLEDKNQLNVKVFMYPTATLDMIRPLEMKNKYQGPLLYCNGVKQFFDGVSSCHTAWIKEEYSNAYFKGDVGKPIIKPDDMKELVFAANRNNMSIRVHTIGDEAIHRMIDYFIEANNIYKNRNIQNTLEHLENFQKEDISRISINNIVASCQPAHAVYDVEGVLRDLGKDRIKLMWPFKSLLNSGCTLAFGTDSPVVEVNPFINIYNAVTRKSFYHPMQKSFLENEKISVYEALVAYTYGSAKANNSSNIIGRLKKGMYADICVLDRNLLKIDVEDIPSTKCLMTMVNGKIVYQL